MNDSSRKTNILVLTSVFPRWLDDATPPFVLNQCAKLVEEGYSVLVVAPHAAGAPFEEEMKGVRVKRYAYCIPFSWQRLCYDGGMLVNLKRSPWLKLMLPFFYLSQLISSLWISLRERPDVLHSHSLLPQGLTGVLIASLLRIPHVATCHGNDVFGLSGEGLMGALKRFVIKRADALTVNSSATREAVLRLDKGSKEKVILIPAVPNESSVALDLVESIKTKYPSSLRVLFVGRLIEEKGVFDLLDAFDQAFPRESDAVCLFVGEGVARSELEAARDRLGLQERVHFAGWRPGHEVASWMAAADILVVPSKQIDCWQEAQGLVVVEAMSVGAKVVASRLGGIPDMVEDEGTGFLFEPGDIEGLKSAILRALDCDMTRIKQEQRRILIERYSSDAVIKATSSLYEEIVQVGGKDAT